MKKSTGVLGVVVILGVAYLGATWYVGKEAQKTIEDAIAQANQRVDALLGPASAGTPSVKLSIDDYQRRFFSSDVTYTLHINDENKGPIDITMQDHLQHGPFPLQALRTGSFAPMLAHSQARLVATPATQAWVDSQKGGSPLLVETHVGFGGAGQSTWTFMPAEVAGNGQQFSFSGGTVNMAFSNDFNDSTSTGQFASFKLDNAQTGDQLQAQNIRIDSQNRAGPDSQVQTQSRATVDRLRISNSNADDEAVSIEQAMIGVESQQAGTILDASVEYGFGRIVVGDIDLGSLSLAGRTRQLDLAALAALASDYEAIAAKHGGQIGQEQALSREEAGLLRDRLAALLASDPSIAIEPLIWKNDKGESKASLQVDLTDPQSADAQTMDALFVQGLKQVKFDLSLSKPMFIQAFGQAESDAEKKLQMEMLGAMIYDQYVGRLQAAGLVKIDGDAAAASMLYEKDMVNVNGQAMTVPEFMQRVFSVVM
ncbi:YdgA family protein [Pusillimonas sp. SM2304]|uniref:YdgA family protein n=1 Tax=Pusillimonas sp. SM2304 TaxID=3073241 RepID=UPI002873F7DD|nr:YdgA family protein [Pusillimonas sp. SM2304]MDS1141017.1 YdgA family protein [Pusillimonas sp. SM2304]